MKKTFKATTLIVKFTVLMQVIFTLNGCKKAEMEDRISVKSPKDTIALKNGVLSFSSDIVFQNTIKYLEEKNDEKILEAWEAQWKDFKSMRTAYNNLNSSDEEIISSKNDVKGTVYEGFMSLIGSGEEREAVRNIPGNGTATVINKEGLVYVGNKALRFTYDHFIEISNPDNYSKTQLLAFDSTSNDKNVLVRKITRKIVQSYKQNIQNSAREENCINRYWHGNSLCCYKRVAGELHAWGSSQGSAGYIQFFVKVKHQRRTSGIWYAHATSELRCDNTALTVYGDNFGPITHNGSGKGSNISELTIWLIEHSNPRAKMSTWNGNFSATCNDGQNRGCSVSASNWVTDF